MRIRFLKHALAITCVIIPAFSANSAVFPCIFGVENKPEGRPNQATCSMRPDIHFNFKKNWEHCNVNRVRMIRELQDVQVDLDSKVVKWNSILKIADHEKSKLTQKHLKEGKTSQKAAELSEFTVKNKYQFDIKSHTILTMSYGGEYLYPKKLGQLHIIVFQEQGDDDAPYVLQIQDWSSHAILTQTNELLGYALLDMRFGRCNVST